MKDKKENTVPEEKADETAAAEETQEQDSAPAQEAGAEEKLSPEEELKAQIKEKDDKYLRLLAEYDNFRKRSQKEKSEIYKSSKAEVIEEILPILDNFERAAANSEADFEGYKKGIGIIFSQFLKILEKFGVESFGEEGDTFDPNIHSAVMVVEDENLPENTIAQVFGKGYKLGDRIIREAVVKVANT